MASSKPSPSKAAKRKRILIVDDHPMLREGLRAVIDHQPDMVVCCEAGNAHQAMTALQKFAPDLALVDITLPGKSGLELVKDIKAMYPRLLVLAMSMHEESLYAERMLRAGASGYISKHQPTHELVHAIRQVLAGRVYASKDLSERILRLFSRQPQPNVSPLELLTDREFEILQLIGEGKTQKDIARQLHLAPKTVAVHAANIRQKLQLKSAGQLIRFAVQCEDLGTPARHQTRK